MKYLLEYNNYIHINFNESFVEWFGDSKVVNIKGYPLKVYHQTSKEAEEGIMKTGFDVTKGRARLSDHIVPDGFFFKDNKDDIGLGSADNPVQMEFYLSIQNPLYVENRKDFIYNMCKLSKEYCDAHYDYEEMDAKMKKEFDTLHDTASKSREMYRKMHPDIDKHLKKWHKWSIDGAIEVRKIINKVLIENNYDGVIFEQDQGSWGRVTKTYIALYPHQIKKVDNKTFTKSNLVTEKKVSYII